MLCSTCFTKHLYPTISSSLNASLQPVRSLYALIEPQLQAIHQFFKRLCEDAVDYVRNKNVFVISSHLFQDSMEPLQKISLICKVLTLLSKDREEVVLLTKQILSPGDDINETIDLVASLPEGKRSSSICSIIRLLTKCKEMNGAKKMLQFIIDKEKGDEILGLTERLINHLNMQIVSKEKLIAMIDSIAPLPTRQREQAISGIEQLYAKPLPEVYLVEDFKEVMDLFKKVLTDHGEGIIPFLKQSLNDLNLQLRTINQLKELLKINDFTTVFSKQSLMLLKDIIDRIRIDGPTLIIPILKKIESIDKMKVQTILSQAALLILTFWPSPPLNLDTQILWKRIFNLLLNTLNDLPEHLIKERIDYILLYTDVLQECSPTDMTIEQFFTNLLRIPTDSKPPPFTWPINSIGIQSDPRRLLLKFIKLAHFQKKIPEIIYFDSPAINAGGVTRDFITKTFHELCSPKNLKLPGELKDGFVFPTFSEDPSLWEEEIACFEALGIIFNYALTHIENIVTGQYFHPLLFQLLYALSQKDIRNIIRSPLPFDAPSSTLQPIYNGLLKIILPQKYPAIFGKPQDPATITIVNQFVDEGKMPPALQDAEIKTKEEFIKQYNIHLNLAAVFCIAKSFPYMSPNDWSEFKGSSSLEFSEKIQGSLSKECIIKNLAWEIGEGVSQKEKDRIEGFLIKWITEAKEKPLKKFIQAISSNISFSPHQTFFVRLYPNGEDVPGFHTCSIIIDIPSKYPTYEIFKGKLHYTLSYLKKTGWGFQFA